MISLLLLGFLIGMKHALEADHVAAVATLAVRSKTAGGAIRQGIVWGIGHSITLFAFGSIVLLLDAVIPEHLANALELVVGFMLVLLGADVLRRLVKERVHFHAHAHGEDRWHLHAHSHRGEERTAHDPRAHDHAHAQAFPLRALVVGLVHGMAGSAALILLALNSVTTPLAGVMYMLLFGLGSIAGMGLLSAAIVIPLTRTGATLTRLHGAVQIAAGTASVALGVAVLVRGARIALQLHA